MPDYRLYHLDQNSGHITRADELFAADDEAALADVRGRGLAHPLELWCGPRKVARVDAIRDAAALVPRQPA